MVDKEALVIVAKARADGVTPDLEDANLRGAHLWGANLEGANLRGAHLAGARMPAAPVVPDLDRKVAECTSAPGALDMERWHTCETTHCRAGWAITLAGKAGAELERRVGPAVAGTLIYHASTGYVPEFYCNNEDAMQNIQARAKLARAKETAT